MKRIVICILLVAVVVADISRFKRATNPQCTDKTCICRDGRDGRDGISIKGPGGSDGRDGRDGTNCVECARGPIGPKGVSGQKGATGPRGATGPIGLKGARGATGPTGPHGAAGKTGSTGAKGDRGVPGICDTKVLGQILTNIKEIQTSNTKLTGEINALKQKLDNEINKNKAIQSKFVQLQSDKKILQSILPAGYGSYSLYDLQWNSLHMAAAAACRGSTPTGGTGSFANTVLPRKAGRNCGQMCAESKRICDAEVSISGSIKKAVKYESVALFYNYGCNANPTWGDEISSAQDDVIKIAATGYISYCCCRKSI